QHGDMLLFVTAEQGALTVIANYRLDRETGEALWRLGGSHGALLAVYGDIGWFSDIYWVGGSLSHAVSIDLVNLNTGEIVESKGFIPYTEGSMESEMMQGGQPVIVDDQLFIVLPHRGEVVQIHIEADEDAEPT